MQRELCRMTVLKNKTIGYENAARVEFGGRPRLLLDLLGDLNEVPYHSSRAGVILSRGFAPTFIVTKSGAPPRAAAGAPGAPPLRAAAGDPGAAPAERRADMAEA